MPFDFDPSAPDTMDGFGEQEVADDLVETEDQELPVPGAPAGLATNSAVEQLLSPEPQEEDYEKVLSQVDRRMRVAHFYRSILEAALFSEDTSEARIVQNRIRKFCNDELEVIFGMKSATSNAGGQFTAEEVKFLKDLIGRLSAVEEAKKQVQAKPPAVNKIQSKPAPTVQTVRTQPSAPKPVLAAAKPPAPAPKAPPAPAKAAPQAKVDMRIPERYRNDPTVQVSKGKVFVQAKNDDGEPLWSQGKNVLGKTIRKPVMRDVTPQAVPTGAMIQPIPMPSMAGGASSAFSQVMQSHADSSLRDLDRLASMPGLAGSFGRQIGGGLAISLMNKAGDEDEYER